MILKMPGKVPIAWKFGFSGLLGVLPRLLEPALDADVRCVVTDLNRPMLDHATAGQGPASRIDWRQADALALAFDDDSFVVV